MTISKNPKNQKNERITTKRSSGRIQAKIESFMNVRKSASGIAKSPLPKADLESSHKTKKQSSQALSIEEKKPDKESSIEKDILIAQSLVEELPLVPAYQRLAHLVQPVSSKLLLPSKYQL